MQGSAFKVTVSLILLSLGGVLAFSPLPEAVAREGHRVLWVVELAWLLRENEAGIRKLWSTARSKMS